VSGTTTATTRETATREAKRRVADMCIKYKGPLLWPLLATNWWQEQKQKLKRRQTIKLPSVTP